MKKKKECEMCGKMFIPRAHNQAYCSMECREGSKRMNVMRFCTICGATIESKGSNVKYCLKCRDVAYRRKKRKWYVEHGGGCKEGATKMVRTTRAQCTRCRYFAASTYTCDYILITEQPRGCKAEECTKWRETR